MHIGAPTVNLRCNRVSLTFVLLILLVKAEPTLSAQDREWHKQMQAGSKASASFKYARAEQEFQAALAQTRAFPPTDLRTAETLSKLAALYVRETKFTEAENRQKQAVAIFEASAAVPPHNFTLSISAMVPLPQNLICFSESHFLAGC
jgi:hypothetical protein